MVATVRNLTSASATSEYFRTEGGYYTAEEADTEELKEKLKEKLEEELTDEQKEKLKEDLRAKQEEHRNGSAWHGEGARALGLEPGKRVSAAKFEKLLQGHVIGTGIRLGRVRDGQHEHRPGFDITFSAPKSVSLAALLPTDKHPRGDRAVTRAHDGAVRATLDWIEKTMLQTRGWDPATGRRPRIAAPALVAATFRHIASRNLDPQLHTHAVVANITRDAEGRWKSVEPTLLHRNAQLIGAYYRDQLARGLIEKGYSIVPTMAGRMPSFEIAGYGRELCDAFSTRRREIVALLEEKGWNYSPAAAQIAALDTRKQKAEPRHATLRTIWADRARQAGFSTAPSVPRSREPIVLPAGPLALDIVRRAMRQLEERQSVFAEANLEALALGHSPGRHSIEEIREAIQWMLRDGHLVEAELRRSDRAFVTERALKAERAVIAAMKTGIGDGSVLAREEEVAAHLDGAGLTEGQEEAVRTVLLASDRIVGVQGRAGTGKTTMLRQVRELAGDRQVIGLAPSAAAARVLERESDIHARTLQWFLTRCQGAGGNGSAVHDLRKLFGDSVLVLDEASMVSTDQMRSLTRIAAELDVARLVLVGDTSQLRAVDAGQPFRQLQQAGMTTARMDDILRQRNPELRAAVLAALAGEPGEAVELLGSSVHEVAYDELGEKAAQTWLELDPEVRDRTLLLAPTHALRAEINRTLRGALREEGMLRGKALVIERLVSLGMTRAEKGDVRNYREDDTIVFHQDMVNYRVKKDEALTVAGIEADRVHLLHPDGRPRSIKPASSIRYRLDVYETQPIEIRAGDRIRWTRNDHARTLINGERAEVTGIDRGRVRLRLEDGRAISLKADDPQLRHIDYAWSSTVHGAQGSTADGVIAVLDSSHGALTDQSTFYVEISRARDRAVVLTDNLDRLVEVLEANTGERASALAAIDERIEPDAEEWARLLPEKGPVWTPREEWTALEARARLEATILFRVDGYAALIERARNLARTPDLPAEISDVTDRLLAYDRACREEGIAAGEFLELLNAHADERRRLENAAETGVCAIAGLEDYPAWRDRSERLAANAGSLLEDLGDAAGEADNRIVERLERLSDLLALDDAVYAFETLRGEVNGRAAVAGTIPFYSDGHDKLVERGRALIPMTGLPAWAQAAAEAVVADSEACQVRHAETVALRDKAAGLLDERRELEGRAREDRRSRFAPPTELEDYPAWLARCEDVRERWAAMRNEPGAWQPHLDRLKDKAAEIPAAIDQVEKLRGHDKAWARLFDMRLAIWEQEKTGKSIRFYIAGWETLVEEARSLLKRKGLPDAAKDPAKRVLDYDRACRKARDAVEGFRESAEKHRERWEALQEERGRRALQEPEVSTVDLPDYAPLSGSDRGLRRSGRAILEDRERYGPHLDRIPGGEKGIVAALEPLERHELLDRFVEAMERLEGSVQAARDRGIPPFQNDAWRQAVDEAEKLAKEHELEKAAQRRLQNELEEHAFREAEWLAIERLLQQMAELDGEYAELEESAARETVPISLVPEWRAWQERNQRFEEDARWRLYVDDFVEYWHGFSDVVDRLDQGSERALQRLSEPEMGRVAEMVSAELARLRDPDAEHKFSREWWGGEPLVAGDRLCLGHPPGGPDREAVVLWPGRGGGSAVEDVLTLEWVDRAPGYTPEERIERISVQDLAGCGVRRADWSNERLRDAELARQQPGPSAAFPIDCQRDVVVGDRVHWSQIVEPKVDAAWDDRASGAGKAQVVQFEGQLVARTAAKEEREDRCKVEVLWRSDEEPCVPMDMSFALLTAGGLWRAFWDDEEERESEAREQKEELEESRELLHRPGPHMSMKIG